MASDMCGRKMKMSNGICYVIIILITCAACGAVIWYRNKIKNIMNKISDMLDCAINNNFKENTYDETMLSALEIKLNRFLLSSLVVEENLSKEKERIQALISDISHQTKTPIANILLYAELLSEQDDLTKEQAHMVYQVCSQTEKLSFLVEALVKTSRLETGIITVVPSVNFVNDLINWVMNEVKAKAESKGIDIKYEENKHTACFDKKWTSEALYNILDNAVKYSLKNSCISISVIPYELFCRIDVIDQGAGILEEDLNLIFRRFYRSPAVNQDEGVGIGLFLAREIISMQGGYIKVKSKVGEGSVFSVFLPRG